MNSMYANQAISVYIESIKNQKDMYFKVRTNTI